MNIVLALIVVAALWRARVSVRGIDTARYLDRHHTTAVNGLFILIVFASHIKAYLPPNPSWDGALIAVTTWLGQLMVALFLFYSGFGIGESIKTKPGYVRTIPVRRILATLINFSIAILAFLAVNIALGTSLGLSRTLLAFIGWTSIGNSNWYIFAILAMWLLTYIAFRLIPSRPVLAITLTWALAIGFTVFMYFTKGPQSAYSFNTVLCFPAGLTYSYLRAPAESWLTSNQRWLVAFAGSLAVFAGFRALSGQHYMLQEFHAIAFCAVGVLLTLKVQLRSPILVWFGRHLFWIYVLQRLPMMVLRGAGLNESSPYLFVAISFIVTVVLAVVFARLVEPLSRSAVAKLS